MSRQQQPEEREEWENDPVAQAEYAEFMAEQERDRKMVKQWEQEQAQ